MSSKHVSSDGLVPCIIGTVHYILTYCIQHTAANNAFYTTCYTNYSSQNLSRSKSITSVLQGFREICILFPAPELSDR